MVQGSRLGEGEVRLHLAPSDTPSSGEERVLCLWRLRCIRAAKQHYWSVLVFRLADRALTVLNICAGILVLFVSLIYSQHVEDRTLPWASVAVVITSVLQFIFDWRIRWVSHDRAATEYAVLGRALEFLNPKADIVTELELIRTRFDATTRDAPTVPFIFWERPKALSRSIAELEGSPNAAD
jgi:hypothetical protein